MTVPDRTGGAGPVGGASAGSGTSGPPVPESAAGAVDARLSAPAAPELTAGAARPEPAASAVTHGGWAMSLTLDKAHYVPAGPILDIWFDRPIALALDGWNALVDKQGLEDGAKLPPCLTCSRALARLSAPREPGGQS